jgi:hypothetical protein
MKRRIILLDLPRLKDRSSSELLLNKKQLKKENKPSPSRSVALSPTTERIWPLKSSRTPLLRSSRDLTTWRREEKWGWTKLMRFWSSKPSRWISCNRWRLSVSVTSILLSFPRRKSSCESY